MPQPPIEQVESIVGSALDRSDISVRDLRQLTGGASRETWACVAQLGGERRELIIRRDPPAAMRGAGEMAREASAIQAASRAGVPVPQVIAHSEDPSLLETPYMIMDFVAGETRPRRILGDERFAELRAGLARECGEVLARIHAIEPAEIDHLQTIDGLQNLRTDLDGFDDPVPALELGMRWLELNAPPPGPAAVVHGDFRIGNLIVEPGGLRAVLDWETVSLGQPMQDLGYLCARSWRYGFVEHPVGGFGAYDDLIQGYEAVSGASVDRAAVRWWQLFSSVRWGVGCMWQAWRHLSGEVRSIELAAIGLRVWEQEYDVLVELDELGAGA